MMSRFALNPKPGEYLIQIEVECLEHETYTEKQYEAITWLCQQFDFKVKDWNLLTHQDTASYKPHLEKERLNILRRLSGGDLLLWLQLKLRVLQLRLFLRSLMPTVNNNE